MSALSIIGRTLLPAALVLALRSTVGAADPFEVHAILELTGSAGFVGANEVYALHAMENRINATGGIDGRPLKFVVHDAGSNPEVAVQVTNELVADKLPLFLGASLAATCSAEMPLLKGGPVAFCLSNAVSPPPGSFMFAATVATENVVSAGLRYARLRRLHRIAAIVTTDASGQNGERAIQTAMTSDENKSTLMLVDLEHFAVTDLTVSAQIARIKAAAPDLLVVWTTGPAAGTVLRALQTAGMDKLPVLSSPGNATYAQMQQYAAFLPHDLYFALPAAMLADAQTDAVTRRLVKEMRDAITRVGGKIDISVTATWDSSLLALGALRKVGVNATPEQVRAYLAGLKGLDGVAGHYDFVRIPQRGIGDESEFIGRWDSARGTWIGVSKPGGVPL